MNSLGNINHVFASSNTHDGIHSLLNDKLSHSDASKLYVIKGSLGTGKSSFLQRLGTFLTDAGYDVTFYHNTINSSLLDGIYIPCSDRLVITTDKMNELDSKVLRNHLIDFDLLLDIDKISDNNEIVSEQEDTVTRNLEKSKFYLKSAQAIYNSYIYTTQVGLLESAKVKYENARIKNVFQIAKEKDGHGSGMPSYLYSYALTSDGIVDYIHTLIGESKTIYLIKENMVCQSKDLMRKLHDLFLEHNYDIVCSISPFDEQKIEDIIIPELSFAITVSNLFRKPKIFPTDIFDFDHCVDYEALVPISVESDNDFDLFLSLLDKAYNAMNNANKGLTNMKAFYAKYMNFAQVDVLFKQLSQDLVFQ